MKFGHFFLPVSLDPSDDFRLIDDCLHEAEMVEELGWDAVWLSEHHFGGETAYADPLVFGGAVAAKTKRVQLGFSVVEVELHNPVRLAIQTALVDNISRGRLVVGLGRGSRYNVFEYKGFGTTMEAGRDHLEEAEELLVKAWTTDSLNYAGKYCQVSFPFIRPRPYQRPHPPLARACATDQSVIEMARIGRPILLYCPTIDGVKHALELYHDTLRAPGADEAGQAVATMWESVGISVTQTVTPYSAFRPGALLRREFAGVSPHGNSATFEPIGLGSLFYSSTSVINVGVEHPAFKPCWKPQLAQWMKKPDGRRKPRLAGGPTSNDPSPSPFVSTPARNRVIYFPLYQANLVWPIGPELGRWEPQGLQRGWLSNWEYAPHR